MSKYDRLKKQNTLQTEAEISQYKLAQDALDEMSQDAIRTVEIYNNAEKYLDDIDERFEKATGLNKTDSSILMLAAALQIGRWVIIGALNGTVTDKLNASRKDHNDRSIVDMEKEKRKTYQQKHADQGRIKSKEHRDWENIIFETVPYDITVGSVRFGVNMEASYHRIHTLGHDPVLGWIFGTMNILSDTITLDDFRTFDVYMGSSKSWISQTTLVAGFSNAIDSVKENNNRLPAAVFAQALHFKSDVNTKRGLAIPVLETFAPDFAGKLYKEGYDSLCLMKDMAVVGTQTTVSMLINLLITLIHGLYFNSDEYSSRDIYEVKTRKILMWSNVIASSSNAVSVAGLEVGAFFSENPELAKMGWQYMDIGGYIVTMHRLVSDTQFIHKVKREFLEKEWDRLVVGDDFSFVSEGISNE